MTPRKFRSQLDVYVSLQKQKYGEGADSTITHFIDELPDM